MAAKKKTTSTTDAYANMTPAQKKALTANRTDKSGSSGFGSGATGGETDTANQVADAYFKDWYEKNVGNGSFITFGDSGSGSSASATAAAKAAALAKQNKLITQMLGQYSKTANQQATNRYNQYLTNLNNAKTTATTNIQDATKGLLANLPTTYTPPVTAPILNPQAAGNPYQQYLQGMGANTTDIGNLQQFANMQSQANTNLQAQTTAARNAAYQQYIDSMRATANQAGTAAIQKLNQQVPLLQAQAQSVYGNTQQNILSSLLPYLVQNPNNAALKTLLGMNK